VTEPPCALSRATSWSACRRTSVEARPSGRGERDRGGLQCVGDDTGARMVLTLPDGPYRAEREKFIVAQLDQYVRYFARASC